MSSCGRLMPQNPNAPTGGHVGCMTIAITGVPDNATHPDVIRMTDRVIIPHWLDTVDWSQQGKNLYHRDNLTPRQLAQAPSHLSALK